MTLSPFKHPARKFKLMLTPTVIAVGSGILGFALGMFVATALFSRSLAAAAARSGPPAERG